MKLQLMYSSVLTPMNSSVNSFLTEFQSATICLSLKGPSSQIRIVWTLALCLDEYISFSPSLVIFSRLKNLISF